MVDSYVSVDDAAVELGMARATVWKWIKRHEIPTFRVPGERRTFIRRDDVSRIREPIQIEPGKELAA